MMSLHQATALFSLWRPSMNNAAVFAFIILFCLCPTYCEEECLKSKVTCYECESVKDPNCNDPFNATAISGSKIECEGCCVKVVRDRNTPEKSIWRTCTNKLQINLFMVDHVCMEESGGQGHMCFCESDSCNASPPTVRPDATSLLLTTFLTSTLFVADWPQWLSIFGLTYCNQFRMAFALLVLACISLFNVFFQT